MIDVKKNLNLLIFAALFVVALGVALFFFFKENKAHGIVATKLESTFDELKRLRDKGTTDKRVGEIKDSVTDVTSKFKRIHEKMLDWHDKVDTMTGPRFQGYLRAQAGAISKRAKRETVFITEDVMFLGLKSVDEAMPGRAEVPGLMKKLSSGRDVVKLLIANKVLTIDSLVFEGGDEMQAVSARGRGRRVDPSMGMDVGRGGDVERGRGEVSGGGLYEKISFQVVFTATYPVMTSFLSDLMTPPSDEDDPEKKLSNFLIVKNLSIAPVEKGTGSRFDYDVGGRGVGGGAGFKPGAARGPGMGFEMGAGMGRRRKEETMPKRKKKVAPEGTRFPKYNVLQVTVDIDMIDFTQQFLDVLNPPRRGPRDMGRRGVGREDSYGRGDMPGVGRY
jgi:hypothetical protein